MAGCVEEIDFRQEANSIISDISFAVKHIDISSKLNKSKDCVYMNIVTLEGLAMCVQLDTNGLKVFETLNNNTCLYCICIHSIVNDWFVKPHE